MKTCADDFFSSPKNVMRKNSVILREAAKKLFFFKWPGNKSLSDPAFTPPPTKIRTFSGFPKQ